MQRMPGLTNDLSKSVNGFRRPDKSRVLYYVQSMYFFVFDVITFLLESFTKDISKSDGDRMCCIFFVVEIHTLHSYTVASHITFNT